MDNKLFNRSFVALLIAQALNACNDNVLKQMIALQVVAGIWTEQLGQGGQGIITVIFTMPFLLFSGWAGQLADKVAKPKLAQYVKLFEIVIGLSALAALWMQSLILAILSLLLLGFQSTLFGPVKFGMLPEMFSEEKISRANGTMNMLSQVAIVIGVVIAGALSDRYPAHNISPGVIIILIAIVGYGVSRFILPLPARDPETEFSLNPVKTYWQTLVFLWQRRTMLVVVLAWAFFSLIAVMVLQAVLDFKTLLDLTDKATSYLNLPLVVGLIIGSGSASLLSKDRIYMPLVPVGAAGITVIFVSLWLVPPSYVFTTVCLIGLGTFGGLYLVPLQSWIQSRSPKEKRGRILGTSYFISFTFIALGGALYWLLRSQLGLNVLQMLLFCGVLTLISTGYLNWRIRGLFKEDIPNE